MSDLLALFDQFRKERTYLMAVSPKTDAWYATAFKAFQAAPGEGSRSSGCRPSSCRCASVGSSRGG
jgi:hypothetical protein